MRSAEIANGHASRAVADADNLSRGDDAWLNQYATGDSAPSGRMHAQAVSLP